MEQTSEMMDDTLDDALDDDETEAETSGLVNQVRLLGGRHRERASCVSWTLQAALLSKARATQNTGCASPSPH
jgi:hypothetical protein